MQQYDFGILPDGRTVAGYVLASAEIELRVISYGAIITSLRVACRAGRREDVVLGHRDLEGYLPNRHYLGAVVGRYANRIAHGRFSLNGCSCQLATNDGDHHLHGGVQGFDRYVWDADVIDAPTEECIAFSRTSPAGEEHYPGTVRASVSYRLRDNVLEIHYAATTDADTPLNLTQHSYFNLSGDPGSPILDHELTIYADKYTPVDGTLIPQGDPAAVDGTPFDFRTAPAIGDRLTGTHEQLRRGGGFDHNWVLNGPTGVLKAAATLRHPQSGRVLQVATTEPGLQFYGGQLLGRSTGASPDAFRTHAGLCLETQHFPDSPNRPDFPSAILAAGERYESLTTWTFSVA